MEAEEQFSRRHCIWHAKG